MSLHYHLVERTVLAGEDAGKKKFYAQVQANEFVDYETLCKQVSKLSTANKGEVSVVLNSLVDVIEDHLRNGHIIQMGDLGNFRPSAGSKGVDSEEEFTLNLMRKPKVLFTPGRCLRNVIAKARFRRFKMKIQERTKACDRTHLGE